MTIRELHTNEELRRHEFPVCRDQVFLGHAGVAPLPRRVAEAITTRVQAATTADQDASLPANFIADTRRLVAGVLHAEPDEIAFVGPTSTALSYLAAGLPWKRGHNVVVYQDCFPSNVYPWLALADRGVEVRYLSAPDLGKIRLLDVQFAVDEQTKVVALASAHFISGWRPNLEAIGKWLHSRNVLLCVDAIQTLGAFPTTVEHIDLLAADAHKWLLGPCAAGVLYVRRDLHQRLQPLVHGWHNVVSPNFITQEQLCLRPDARRYEAGTHNLIGLAGLRAAFALAEEIGIENIAAEISRQRAWLAAALLEKGYEVLHPTLPPENASGILSFTKAGEDMAALHQRLTDARVMTSLRNTRDLRQWLRLSPHFYNTDAELQRVMELL